MFLALFNFIGPTALIRWAFYGVIVAGATGFLAYEHHKVYDEGYAAAISDVRAANAKSNAEASKGQSNVEACYIAGGTWDRDNGVCVRPAS
jgi:hypothetical protein